MRMALLLVLAATLASSARADVPLFVQVSGGGGTGGGWSSDRSGGGSAMVGALDLGWRGGKHAYVLSLEAMGANPGMSIGMNPHLGSVDHGVVLLGLERSRTDSGGVPYLHFGAGVGSVSTDHGSSAGLAVGAGAGVRIISPARELGFMFGLRGTSILTGQFRTLSLALMIGVVAHPR